MTGSIMFQRSVGIGRMKWLQDCICFLLMSVWSISDNRVKPPSFQLQFFIFELLILQHFSLTQERKCQALKMKKCYYMQRFIWHPPPLILLIPENVTFLVRFKASAANRNKASVWKKYQVLYYIARWSTDLITVDPHEGKITDSTYVMQNWSLLWNGFQPMVWFCNCFQSQRHSINILTSGPTIQGRKGKSK